MKGFNFMIGCLMAGFTLAGLIASVIIAGPNGPHGGDPWVFLPYGVVVVGTAAWLLIKQSWEEK